MLVVSDLRSETKGSCFECGYYLCAEVSSLQCLSVCEAGASGSKELKKMPSPFTCSPLIRECS